MEPLPPWLMFVALFGAILAGLPVAYSLIVVSLLFGLPLFGSHLGQQFYGRFYEVASNYTLAAVPLFIFMGVMLERSGIAERLFNAMQLWLGRLPGGLAVAVIAMCAIFAASTGIIGAVEVVVGLMAIAPMLRYGYSKDLISGTICAGGSLGTLIPPSVLVVIYAGVGSVSVGDLFAGVLIPGLLTVTLFILYIMLRCWLRPQDGPPLSKADVEIPLGRKLAVTVSALVPATLLVTAVLGSILAGIASPTEAAAVGALGAMILTMLYGRFNLEILGEVAHKTVTLNAMILLIVVGGMMFSSVFIVGGGNQLVRDIVEAAGLSATAMMMLFLFIIIISGFVLDWVTIVLICIPIFTPMLRDAGVDLVWFAVMAIVAIQTSYLTPPMAPTIFYLRAIAPREISYGHMARGVMPFVGILVIVLVIVGLVPATATYLPFVLFGF